MRKLKRGNFLLGDEYYNEVVEPSVVWWCEDEYVV